MRACSLNSEGLVEMTRWLDESAEDASSQVPNDLMVPGKLASPVSSVPGIRVSRHGSRFQFAAWLDSEVMLPSKEVLARDAGFWAWLTLAHFDELCPAEPDGRRKVGALVRYVPSFDEWRRYYRHLLAGPWMIYRAHRERPQAALGLLAGPLAVPGEVVEQFAARMEWATNQTVMEVVTSLYLDRARGQLKKGAGGKGRGSARRLAAVLWQFDRTFDLYSVPTDRLIAMLPEEFERYKPRTA